MSEGKEKVNGMFGVSSKAWKRVWKTGKASEMQATTLPLTGIAILLPELMQRGCSLDQCPCTHHLVCHPFFRLKRAGRAELLPSVCATWPLSSVLLFLHYTALHSHPLQYCCHMLPIFHLPSNCSPLAVLPGLGLGLLPPSLCHLLRLCWEPHHHCPYRDKPLKLVSPRPCCLHFWKCKLNKHHWIFSNANFPTVVEFNEGMHAAVLLTAFTGHLKAPCLFTMLIESNDKG